MFDKTKLIKMAAHYFQDKNREVMYATTDGNIFYESNLANGHASGRNLEVISIYRKDVIEVSPILDEEIYDSEILETEEVPEKKKAGRKPKK